MATSSSDCGDNGYCIWEFRGGLLAWSLLENEAKEGFVCETPPVTAPELTPNGALMLICAESASSE
jgi:hypothetical protein